MITFASSGIGSQPGSIAGFFQIAGGEGKDSLNGIFFGRVKNEAIQLEKCYPDSKTCPLIAVYKWMISDYACGIDRGVSAVTWGEVFYLEWRYRGEAKAYETEANVRQLPIAIISVDQGRATRAGAIKQKYGVSYADSFAAELAIEQRAWLVTADQDLERIGKTLPLLLLPRYEM